MNERNRSGPTTGSHDDVESVFDRLEKAVTRRRRSQPVRRVT